MIIDNPVILFDGYCNLCNRMVDFIIRHDRDHRFRFISLQDPGVKDFFSLDTLPLGTDSVILAVGSLYYTESDAALKIAALLGFPWKILVIFRVVPLRIRNGIYRVVARNRYHWFGRKDTCRVAGPDEEDRFL